MTVDNLAKTSVSASPGLQTRWAALSKYADALWMVVLALAAAAVYLNYNLFLQALPHDTTFHIYAAQQILEGHPIYRDVAIIKAPLADFATALALVGARLIDISDVMGARLLGLSAAMATTAVTYLAGRVLFDSRAVGVLAGLVMAGFDFYGLRAVSGPEPKAFVILFALLAFIFVARRRWAWAGLCAMLAALAWQPGLMVVAIVTLTAVVDPFVNRTGTAAGRGEPAPTALANAGRVLIAAVLPLGVLALYLVANDAVGAAWNATIAANVTHLNTTTARMPLLQMVSENVAKIVEDGGQFCFSPIERWLLAAGTVGFVGIAASQVVHLTQAVRQRSAQGAAYSLAPAALVLYGLGFAAFTLLDFQYCPDLFPLLPVLALGIGWLSWQLAQGAGRAVARGSGAASAGFVRWAVLLIAGGILIGVYMFDVREYTVRGVNFQDQRAAAAGAAKYIKPGDRILALGDAIVLVQGRLRNASRILHLGSKSGLGVLLSEPGGVEGWLAALDRDPPRVITLARETRPEWSAPFYEWLARRYVEVERFNRAGIRVLLLNE